MTSGPAKLAQLTATSLVSTPGEAGRLSRLSDSIVENVNVWLNVLDTDLNIVLWNRVAESISGFPRQEVLGHNKLWEWMYPDEAYRRDIMERTKALLETVGGFEYFETVIVCKNGKTKNISWNSRSLFDEDGNIYGVITSGYDLTERKEAEAALRKVNNEISALYHIASVASGSLDLDTILERSLDGVLNTMNSDKGLIHLWDEAEESLRLAAHQGISNELASALDEVRGGIGLTGWVFTHNQPYLTSDLMQDSSNPKVKLLGISQAYVGVPMRAMGRVVGVFGVLGETGRLFNPDEVTLLGSIADQVGVAVENARLYQRAEQLAVLEERERLAHDLHDSVTQSLYSLTLLAEASRRLIHTQELDLAGEYILQLGETAQDALKEMRLLVYKLRPPALEREGLVGAIQQRLGAVERRAGVKAQLITGDPINMSPAVEEALYRIAQEALNNALKHARASAVIVRIQTHDDRIHLEIEDNGCGFDQELITQREGMGLAGMQERAKRFGGTISIESAPGQGTLIRACMEPGLKREPSIRDKAEQ